MSPRKGVRAGELRVVAVGCLPGPAALPVRAVQHVIRATDHQSDDVDAEAAARAVPSTRAHSVATHRDGKVETLRNLRA